MFGGPVNSGLTLGKVVTGISKTLGVVNQVIPLYKEAKPMINNAKTIMNALKGINSSPSKQENISIEPKKDTINEVRVISTNRPSFFL